MCTHLTVWGRDLDSAGVHHARLGVLCTARSWYRTSLPPPYARRCSAKVTGLLLQVLHVVELVACAMRLLRISPKWCPLYASLLHAQLAPPAFCLSNWSALKCPQTCVVIAQKRVYAITNKRLWCGLAALASSTTPFGHSRFERTLQKEAPCFGTCAKLFGMGGGSRGSTVYTTVPAHS